MGFRAPAENVERLSRSDWRLIWIAIAVAAVSLWIARRYFHRAFPEASIDFQVSGAGSGPVAQRFLAARGWSTAGFDHAEQFGYDNQAKTFLERELGLRQSSALLSGKLQLWRWENRWFKPLSEEQFRVAVSTSGQVVGFSHTIPDAAPGDSLTQAEAQARAEAFLTQVMHLDWHQWIAVGVDRNVKPHRTDYTFTWKDANPLVPQASGDVAAAEHLHVVRIQGSEVAAYHQFLKVPETWQRGYARLRSHNETTGLVDTVVLVVVFIALLFVLLMRIRRGDVRWRLALWVAAAGGGLKFLAALNAFGAERFAYNSAQSWGSFLLAVLVNDVAGAVGVAAFLLILTAAAESLYRERFATHTAVEKYLSWRGIRSKSFLISMVLGLALAAFFFAYQTVFYLLANHLGAWAPADVPYDQLLNTRLPWAFVLFSGFFPAISEEFGFRMFAIPLFEKWFRWLWVAVIAASFLWGFGHATYPNQPFYIRGVEVGLGGILLSWIMIRFGILATVVWHYTVDAFYTAMLLLGAHDAYLRWSGVTSAFLAVLPLLIAIGLYWRYHGFSPAAELTNAAVGTAAAPAPEPAPEAVALPPYEPISGPNWTAGLIVAGVLLSAFAVPTLHWRSVLPWRTGRGQAIASARQFLQAHGFSAADDRVAATLETALESGHGLQNRVAAATIFAQRGPHALLHAFAGPAAGASPSVPAAYWHVRFYRPLNPEEFNLAVRPDTGAVIAFSHALPESAPGAAPPLAAAQQKATAFLAQQGMAAASMKLQSAQQQTLSARTDSSFVWSQAPPSRLPLPQGIDYRVGANLAGNRVSYFAAWYHVPEAALRSYTQGTVLKTVLGALKGLLYAAATVLIVWLLVGFARRRTLSWVALLKVSAVSGVASLILAANAWPVIAARYDTSVPWSAFQLSVVFGWSMSAAGGFLLTLVLLAPLAITAPHVTALRFTSARRQLERDSAWDALWVGLLALAWALGWMQVRSTVNHHWYSAGTPFFPQPPDGLAHLIPGLSDVVSAPLHALWIAAFLGIVLPVLWRAWQGRDRGWSIAGVVLIWVGTIPSIHTATQFALAAIFSALGLALLFAFGLLFLRSSPLAYVSAVLVPSLVMPALEWLTTPTPGAAWPGVVLLGLATAWLAALAWISRRPVPLSPNSPSVITRA